MNKHLSIEEKDADVEEFLIWKTFPMGGFFYKNRRKLLILSSALIILDIMLASFFFPGPNDPQLTGGIDACIQYESGEPYLGKVHLSGATKITGSQGCFFFTGLQPGVHSLSIPLQDSEYRQAVRVRSGEATSLGVILLDP